MHGSLKSMGALALGLAVIASAAARVQAQPLTTAFTYQAELRNSGAPANGVHDFRFRLYDAASAGSLVGATICLDNVSVAGGRFHAALDFGAVFAGAQRFLEIEVRADTGLNCGSAAGFVLLAPRQALGAAPNALFALSTAQLNGQPPTFYQNAANLTSGTLDAARLPSPLVLSGSSATHVVRGQNTSTTNNIDAIYGLASGIFSGVSNGVHGHSDSSGGRGVYGTVGSLFGIGVYGKADAGTGVYGIATNSGGITYGVHGRSDSFYGQGVFGEATREVGTTYGVYGQSASNEGRGVFGLAVASSGVTYGGVFQSYSPGGRGVRGYCSSATGFTYAVFGESDSTDGRGVYGFADGAGAANYGVYGRSVNGVSVYANGSSVTTGSKSFRIDHPADPSGKYLLHYSMESPEVLNVYCGKVTLNGAGEAVVELPVYFAQINKDPRYLLTAIGASMPGLFIAEEISAATLDAGGPCSFRIAGGAPNAKVSWEIKAVRNDRWMRQHGAPVEVEKQSGERGTYQHPELYGQPPELGMNYDTMTSYE